MILSETRDGGAGRERRNEILKMMGRKVDREWDGGAGRECGERFTGEGQYRKRRDALSDNCCRRAGGSGVSWSLLIMDLWPRWTALALISFTTATLWLTYGPSMTGLVFRPRQNVELFQNLAIIGGCSSTLPMGWDDGVGPASDKAGQPATNPDHLKPAPTEDCIGRAVASHSRTVSSRLST